MAKMAAYAASFSLNICKGHRFGDVPNFLVEASFIAADRARLILKRPTGSVTGPCQCLFVPAHRLLGEIVLHVNMLFCKSSSTEIFKGLQVDSHHEGIWRRRERALSGVEQELSPLNSQKQACSRIRPLVHCPRSLPPRIPTFAVVIAA